MTTVEWPYDLPIWRRSLRATSPDGRYVAQIDPAYEVSMGNPTSGTLCLSMGLHIERCNPSFLWSEDSRYLAVPQFFCRFGLRRQRLLIVAVQQQYVLASRESTYYFQPESFTGSQLVVVKNPFRSPRDLLFTIPDDLDSRFRPMRAAWPEGADASESRR